MKNQDSLLRKSAIMLNRFTEFEHTAKNIPDRYFYLFIFVFYPSYLTWEVNE